MSMKKVQFLFVAAVLIAFCSPSSATGSPISTVPNSFRSSTSRNYDDETKRDISNTKSFRNWCHYPTWLSGRSVTEKIRLGEDNVYEKGSISICRGSIDRVLFSELGDWITDKYSPEFVPFIYFKELRRRNEARHIEYKKFQELVPLSNVAIR